MAKFAIVLFAAFAVAGVFAAPKKATEKSQLEQIVQQVQSVANDLSATLQNNLPDSKTATKALADQSQVFATNLETIVKKFETEINSNKGKVDDTLKDAYKKLVESVNTFQGIVGPEATAKGQEFATKLDTDFKTIAAEFENLGKAVQPNLEQAGDTLGTFAKGLFDDFVKTAKDFENQVKTTVSKN